MRPGQQAGPPRCRAYAGTGRSRCSCVVDSSALRRSERASSSAGQSSGLIIRRSRVQAPPGLPKNRAYSALTREDAALGGFALTSQNRCGALLGHLPRDRHQLQVPRPGLFHGVGDLVQTVRPQVRVRVCFASACPSICLTTITSAPAAIAADAAVCRSLCGVRPRCARPASAAAGPNTRILQL